ncbi:MAG: erythromycin esterase family protein [candidate division WOR-3 bacterium]|nr:MAG: erythromycin esterase family protein [candidate division WOR-3 bacterium]
MRNSPLCPLLIAALVLAPACRPATVPDQLRARALPVASLEAEHPPDDLVPVAELIGDARVVFIGESRHNGREHMLFRRRLIELLVTKAGFDAVALEEPMPEARLLDRHVTQGEGDAADILARSGNWFIWNTREMLGLVRWLSEYNAGQEPVDQVRIYGLDITTPGTALQHVLAFLKRADPEALAMTGTALGQDLFDPRAWTGTMANYAELTETRRAELSRAYDALVKLLDDNRERYVAATSSDEFAWARREAYAAREANRLFSTARPGPPDPASYRAGGCIREKAMADNLRWVLEREGPDARVIVLAHNVHVGRALVDVEVPGRPAMESIPSIASLLQPDLGEAVFTIGCTYGAEVEADTAARSAEPATLDAMLDRVGLPAYVLPVSDMPRRTRAGRWLAKRRAMQAEGGLAWCVPAETYDALFHTDRLQRTRPIATAAEPEARTEPGPGGAR